MGTALTDKKMIAADDWSGLEAHAGKFTDAVKIAKEKGISVSCDLNYRKKLWSTKQALKTMSRLVEYVDVLIANEEDAKDVFGIQAADSDINKGKLSVEGYRNVTKKLMDKTGVHEVAITLRESISASDNNWSALLYDGKNYYSSKKYSIHLVDRVGGGDAFAAGLIHGHLKGWDQQEILEFAVAASAYKQTINGDVNHARENEILAVARGNVSGRVQR